MKIHSLSSHMERSNDGSADIYLTNLPCLLRMGTHELQD